MNEQTSNLLVSSEWLRSRLGDPDLAIIDATWYLPTEGGDAWSDYLREHIPGAVHVDIDAVSDPNSDLPHMLPNAASFGDAMGRLGIGNDSQVVVYDARGLFSAARVWWMLRAFGHQSVAVLDGGLPLWKERGYPVEQGETTPRPRRYTATPDPSGVCHREDVEACLAAGGARIVDARGAARFRGEAPEPRPGLKSGHIPGSVNLPFTECLDPDTGRLRSADELRELFRVRGIDLDAPVIMSCGSGVTAAVPYLAATVLGATAVRLYDGSWAEWGDPALGLPVETKD